MKLSTKLYGGFGVILIAVIILGGVGVWSGDDLSTKVDDLGATHVPLIIAVFSVESALAQQEKAVTQYMLHGEAKYLEPFEVQDRKVDANIARAEELIGADQELVEKGWVQLVQESARLHDEFVATARTVIKAVKSNQPRNTWAPLADEMARKAAAAGKAVGKLVAANDEEGALVAKSAIDQAMDAKLIIGGVSLASVVLGLLLALGLVRSITKVVSRAVAGLTAGMDQVADASGQVASTSQSLAQGASQQAASLEETSSSMEEMSSMSKQIADNANQADLLMSETGQVVSKANRSMKELQEAMSKINDTSGETAKIIKTIDEIAFQTNLLALNAAVEAARAGEAGAGFAVVADEVRSLAMRAAEAAKNTSGLIEGNLHDIKIGADLASSTSEVFSQIEASAAKAGELVAEIAAATGEQTQGVGQVSRAAAEMDKMTQQVAANAEESAASSEELAAQASTMQGLVTELVVLIEGSNGRDLARRAPSLEYKNGQLPMRQD